MSGIPTTSTSSTSNPSAVSTSLAVSVSESDEKNRENYAQSPPRKKMRIWKAKWQKQEFPVYYTEQTTVDDIKEQLEAQTGIRKEKQKLVGFKVMSKYASTVPSIDDHTLISHITCKSKKKFMLVGTLDQDQFNDTDLSTMNVAYVVDDMDWDYRIDPDELSKRHKQHREKLESCISNTQINVMYPPRKGKKLLVLDIDYTLFDMGGKNEQDWNKLKRPYTDYLLEQCYPYYDIVIWSQTSWKWIEIKLTEMNMLMNGRYNISFVLDKKAMFTVVTNMFSANGSGESRKHYVKPLELIWRKFPQFYNQHNTVHIDDLARNFAMNPNCGLKIKAYKKAHKNKHSDTDLLYLTHYLVLIGKRDDFKGIQHDAWKTYLDKHQPK